MKYRLIFAVIFFASIVFFASSKVYKHRLCHTIQSLPFSDVKTITSIQIEDSSAPYNPGLISLNDEYLMVFRTDSKQRKKIFGIQTPFREKISFQNQKLPYKTELRALFLDRSFKPKGTSIKLDTGSDFAEDPRIFSFKNEIYITYNDLCLNELETRTIKLAKINLKTFRLEEIQSLDPNLKGVEKNWVPFVLDEQIHFVYAITPHAVFKLNDQGSASMTWLPSPNHIALQKMEWNPSFGPMRGGTPPILLGDQYLSFFHSFFKENGRLWYVMGAYTFEARYPFRITSCSKQPIRFKGMYNTLKKNTAFSKKPAIYPSGIVLEHANGRDLLHVACGENDSGIKIITFDKEILLSTLTPIDEYHL